MPRMTARRTASMAGLAAAMLCAACVPVLRNQFPTLTGSVVDGTAVVAHADVLVVRSLRPDCKEPDRVASADDDGRFVLPGMRRIEIAHAAEESRSEWTLCVRSGGRTTIGLWYAGHTSPDALRVRCDLARPVARSPFEASGGGGVCSLER